MYEVFEANLLVPFLNGDYLKIINCQRWMIGIPEKHHEHLPDPHKLVSPPKGDSRAVVVRNPKEATATG